MAGLTAEQITALLGATRQKGLYTTHLNAFVESGEMGVDVGEQWVEHSGKNASTLKQGFDNARTNKDFTGDANQIKVIKNEDKVFLVNLAVAAEQLGEAAAVAS